MKEAEKYFWRGWDYDSFFDPAIQEILTKMHPGNLAQSDPSFEERWAYPIDAWKALDQFRINVASGLARQLDPTGVPLFQFCDVQISAIMRCAPMWFFELAHEIFVWSKEREARFKAANLDRKNADMITAIEYWRTNKAIDQRAGDIEPAENFDCVRSDLENLGFGPRMNEAIRQCVKREDDRRRKIVEKWAQGFASSLNRKTGSKISAQMYQSAFASARDGKR